MHCVIAVSAMAGPASQIRPGRAGIFEAGRTDAVRQLIGSGPGNGQVLQLMTDVLVLCTANVCRSVMTAALLTRRLVSVGATASVRSAGMLGEGQPAAAEVSSVLAARGIDVGAHRSRRASREDLAAADLVLTMTREQLRYAVVTAPAVWPRAFTLKELVRRGQATGPRSPGQPLADWISLAHDGRYRHGLLGDDPADDVADPIGGPPEGFAITAGQLDHLLGHLVTLAWGRQ
jgi:protein-tyrosine phosphatase